MGRTERYHTGGLGGRRGGVLPPKEVIRASRRHQQAPRRAGRPFEVLEHFLCKTLSGKSGIEADRIEAGERAHGRV